MSIYSTINLTPSEAIRLIAEHVCADANEPQGLDGKDDNELLAGILFRLTDGNKHSPYHRNNYIVSDNPGPGHTLEEWKDENFIS